MNCGYKNEGSVKLNRTIKKTLRARAEINGNTVNIKNNSLLLLFVFIFSIYFFLFPLLRSTITPDYDGLSYVLTMTFIFVFTLLPLFLLYFYWRRRFSVKYSGQLFSKPMSIKQSKFWLLYLLFFYLFPPLYLYVSINSGIFFRRIGHEALSESSLSLSTIEILVTRVGNDLFPFFLGINLILYFVCSRPFIKKLFLISFLLGLSTYLLWALANSRTLVLVLLMYLSIIIILVKKNGFVKIHVSKIVLTMFIPVLIFYSVMSIRVGFVKDQQFTLNYFVEVNEVLNSQSGSSFIARLDGVELMTDVTNTLASSDKSFMYGASWLDSTILYYYQIFDKEKAREMKKKMRTTSKVFIYKYYRGEWVVDYSASVLLDLYASFFIFGLLFAALFYSVLIFFIHRTLLFFNNSHRVVLALFLLVYLFRLEFEFITLITNYLKFLFVPVLCILMPPFVTKKQHGYRI